MKVTCLTNTKRKSSKDLIRSLRDASEPSVHPSAEWLSGRQDQGGSGRKDWGIPNYTEMDWQSMAGSDEPKWEISVFSKQFLITLTEIGTKDISTVLSFSSFNKLGNHWGIFFFLKKRREALRDTITGESVLSDTLPSARRQSSFFFKHTPRENYTFCILYILTHT